MKTSIIILTYNQLEYTKLCIESIRKYTPKGSYEIIIIDNASNDETRDWIESQKDIKFVFNEINLGFPAGCNQGIDLAIGENILFLNNDTIVTKRWLENMLSCLWSDDEYGAVSCVTNNISYGQAIPVNYKSKEEMHSFSDLYNKLNPELWEERLKLIGFCMLVKAKVIKEIGKMDEIFSPGNFEDDDYSIRIRKAGYRLILCKDTFIHHFGSVSFKKTTDYNYLLFNNMKKYQKKWGYNPNVAQNIRIDMIEMINAPKEKELNILEVGCGCGGTLLKIKDEYKNCNLYGLELNAAAADVASLIANVEVYNNVIQYPDSFFDYIMITNSSGYNAREIIPQVIGSLKPSGYLLADFPNIMHYDVIKRIIDSSWKSENGENQWYSLNEISELFKQSGYGSLNIKALQSEIDTNANAFIDKITAVSSTYNRNELCTIRYMVSANKSELYEIIRSINLEDSNREELLNKLAPYPIEDIVKNSAFNNHSICEVELLNFLGIIHFENGLHERVLPFFERAHFLERNNKEVIYNLAYYFIFSGMKEQSQKYMTYLKNFDLQLYKNLLEISNDFKV